MPRNDPFSAHDRSTIIAQLARTGEWEGTRDGYRIRFLRFRKNGRELIEFAVRVKPQTWISDQADTVAGAIGEVNTVIVRDTARRAPLVTSSAATAAAGVMF